MYADLQTEMQRQHGRLHKWSSRCCKYFGDSEHSCFALILCLCFLSTLTSLDIMYQASSRTLPQPDESPALWWTAFAWLFCFLFPGWIKVKVRRVP